MPANRLKRATNWRACAQRCARPLALAIALLAGRPVLAAHPDLTALTLEQLLDVKIVGASKYAQTQDEIAAAATVITRKEIRAFGWRSLDEALATLPGIHTTYSRQSTSLGARGFGLPGDFNTRLLVMINGNRVNEPIYDSGVAGESFPVDMDLVERIEFIPGPGGAVYGQNAMFGVVNVITRAPSDLDGAEVSVAYQGPQALREGRASWGKVFDNGIGAMVSLSGMQADGEDLYFDYGAAGVAGIAAGMDAERTRRAYAQLDRGAFSISHAHGYWLKDDPTGTYFSDPLAPGQYFELKLNQTQLQYEAMFAGDRLQVAARAFRNTLQYRTLFRYSGDAFHSDTQSHVHGAELRMVYSGLQDHKLQFGLEGQDSPRSIQRVPVSDDPSDDLLIRSPGYSLGVYAQDEWRIAPHLMATLGLRLDRDDVTGTRASPRTALIWQATPATTLKALYGSANRAPNAFERDYDDGATQVGNPDLRGERIDTLELVTEHRAGQDLWLRASLYQWQMTRLIVMGLDPVDGIPQFQSGRDIIARGAELTADRTWGAGVRLRSSVSWQDVEYRSGGALVNSPELLGKLNISGALPWARLRASYELRYESRRLTHDGSHLGAYAVSNFALTRNAHRKGLEASLGLYNLFDKRYATPAANLNWQDAFEQDGRSVRITLGYQF